MHITGLHSNICCYSAVVTPHKLSWWNASHGLRILLSEQERRNPLVLYFSPGLLVVQLIRNLIIFGFGYLFRILRTQGIGRMSPGVTVLVHIVLFLCGILGSTAIITPLEVLTVRLSIQRNGFDSEDTDPLTQNLEDVVE